jgi:hypothetical protein
MSDNEASKFIGSHKKVDQVAISIAEYLGIPRSVGVMVNEMHLHENLRAKEIAARLAALGL